MHSKVRLTTLHTLPLSLVLLHFFTSWDLTLDEEFFEGRVNFSLVFVSPVSSTIAGIWKINN